jgi:hypothetical protein
MNISLDGNADVRGNLGDMAAPQCRAGRRLFVEPGGGGRAEQLSHRYCSETTLDAV